jgi:hypothetical protein
MFPKRNRSNSAKVNNYNKILAEYARGVWCGCITNEYKQFSSQAVQTNLSRAMRISQTIRSAVGGSTQYGNAEGLQVINYLGKVEGQVGGSGAPPRNRF